MARYSFPSAVYSILDPLAMLPSGLETTGLLNSTLYDVIPIVPGAAGEVAVNATQFQVDCGALHNTSELYNVSLSYDTSDGMPGFRLSLASDKLNFANISTPLAMGE